MKGVFPQSSTKKVAVAYSVTHPECPVVSRGLYLILANTIQLQYPVADTSSFAKLFILSLTFYLYRGRRLSEEI
jgi:hypothetical protein